MLLGIVTLERLLQPEKARVPIRVTGYPPSVSGMMISPPAELSHRVMVALRAYTEYVYMPSFSAETLIAPKANILMHTKINNKDFFFIFPYPS